MMRIIYLLIPLILSDCRDQESPSANPAVAPTKDTDTRLISITAEGFGDQGGRLIAEVRGDSPADREFIDRLWTEHHASFPEGQRFYVGPDASYTEIELVRGSESIIVSSWHTQERTSPRVFASHVGLEPLGDRTRAEALAAEPEAYRRFRASFDAIMEAVIARNK